MKKMNTKKRGNNGKMTCNIWLRVNI